MAPPRRPEMTAYKNRAKAFSGITNVANKYSDLNKFKTGIDQLKLRYF